MCAAAPRFQFIAGRRVIGLIDVAGPAAFPARPLGTEQSQEESGAMEAGKNSDSEPRSVIGAGISITGNIEATADLDIAGRVVGDIRCSTLNLMAESSVTGRVYAERARLGGRLDGGIETKDLSVEAGALVIGDVTYETLRVANGAILEGRLKCSAAGADARLKLVETEVSPKQERPGGASPGNRKG
jgi:cytoskeletal protein CcmA (bactofilin family)